VKGYQLLFENGSRDFTVAACCDVNRDAAEERAEEIAAYQGVKPAVFTELDALVDAEAAQAADVCVPHCFHHTVAIPLLAGGMHVMVEKPLGITIRASQAIIGAAERYGRVLATGENVRRELTARACAWAMREQQLIGDVRRVVVQSISHTPFDYSRPALKWRGLKKLTGGGMIMDSGAHFADMIQVLLGPVDRVSCSMASYDSRMIEDVPVVGQASADVEDTWHAVIDFEAGAQVSWTYSRSFYGEPVRQAVYYGSQGTLYDLGFPFHPFQGGGRALLADGTEVSSEDIQEAYLTGLSAQDTAALFPYGVTDGFAIEVWDFVDAVANGRKPEMDGVDGLRAKALCEACYESATVGSPVEYQEVLEGEVNAYQQPIDAFWDLA
jgi:predicted dehydrogenase